MRDIDIDGIDIARICFSGRDTDDQVVRSKTVMQSKVTMMITRLFGNLQNVFVKRFTYYFDRVQHVYDEW